MISIFSRCEMFRKSLMGAVIIILAFGVTAGAEDSPFNVDVFFGWGGCYRPVEWTPIEVEIASTLKKPFEGVLRISARQDELNNMNLSHYFVLTPDVPLHIPLVAKLAFAADAADASITDRSGRQQWTHRIELWDYSSSAVSAITAVSEDELLIGLVGRSRFGLGQLADKVECRSDRRSGKVYIKDKLPRMLPWDWTGYASLDALILYDPDWSELSLGQLSAISQWVNNGGRLLLVLGSHPIAADSPLIAALPLRIGDAKEINLSPDHLSLMKLESGEPQSLACWSLETLGEPQCCWTVNEVDGNPLVMMVRAGFGRVGIVVFDPGNMSAAHSFESERFWVYVLSNLIEAQQKGSDSRRPDIAQERSIAIIDPSEKPADQQDSYGRYSYGISTQLAGNNAIMEYLYDIAQLRPLSIWWVILLLVILAVLIGPVDYLVLKRLDRLPLTWLTCAGWIALFTIGAYYGVRTLRAGDLQLRVISVSDGVASPTTGKSSPVVWSSVYAGMFAPASDDYTLNGLSPQQWWSAIAPSQSQFYAYRQSIDLRNVYYSQHDGGNLPFSLPVSIWTMQCLLTESPQTDMPFTAELLQSGNRVKLRVANLSPAPIKSGFVMTGEGRVMQFDSVAGSSSREFDGSLHHERVWSVDGRDMGYRYNLVPGGLSLGHDAAFFAQGTLQRTNAILSYVKNGAAVVCVRYDDIPSPFSVKDPSARYEHTQLARLVIFPRND